MFYLTGDDEKILDVYCRICIRYSAKEVTVKAMVAVPIIMPTYVKIVPNVYDVMPSF
jgi:hypothetical protein